MPRMMDVSMSMDERLVGAIRENTRVMRAHNALLRQLLYNDEPIDEPIDELAKFLRGIEREEIGVEGGLPTRTPEGRFDDECCDGGCSCYGGEW